MSMIFGSTLFTHHQTHTVCICGQNSTNQPNKQTTKQPTNQLTNQPTKQPTKQTNKQPTPRKSIRLKKLIVLQEVKKSP